MNFIRGDFVLMGGCEWWISSVWFCSTTCEILIILCYCFARLRKRMEWRLHFQLLKVFLVFLFCFFLFGGPLFFLENKNFLIVIFVDFLSFNLISNKVKKWWSAGDMTLELEIIFSELYNSYKYHIYDFPSEIQRMREKMRKFHKTLKSRRSSGESLQKRPKYC